MSPRNSETTTKSQLRLARLVAALIVALIIFGILRYGFSADTQQRLWRDIVQRPFGPMSFRFVLQPIAAAITAWRDGARDARTGRSPYLWTLLTDSAKSGESLREGLIATARIILLGLCIDLIYQVTVFKTFYPGEAVITAILLAFVPYLLLRGPFCRIARRYLARKSSRSASL